MRNRLFSPGLVGVATSALVSVQPHDPHASATAGGCVDHAEGRAVGTRTRKGYGAL
jgi:hypothetical protein